MIWALETIRPAAGMRDNGASISLNALAGGQRRVVRPGERLYREGDARGSVFIVESGWLKLVRTLNDGQRQIVGFPTQNAILGLESELAHPNDCEALTLAVVHAFPARAIFQLCRDARLAEALLSQAGAQIDMAQTQMASVRSQSAAQKTAALLNALADACVATQGQEFTFPMKRTDIGAFLGVRLETVSRTFSVFRKRGWIAMPAVYRCRITNPRALAMLASGARTLRSPPATRAASRR